MPQTLTKVYYHSHASPEFYALIKQAAGPEFDLAFLHADDDEERSLKLADCEAIICAAHPLQKHHLDAAKNLKVIHHQGVGWQDTTDWQEIRRRKLPLALTLAGTTTGVAEHTVLLMLAAAKRLTFADAELRKGRWHINTLRAESRELFGKTIGYIGMGRVAQAVAQRLKAFGCAGIYYDPEVVLSDEESGPLGLRAGSLDQVFQAADVLTIHVPLTTKTRGLIGARQLARMKRGVIIVNTARGGIIDETSLAQALSSGQVLAAGIDVFEHEPPGADNPLFALPNTVLTPHISAGTRDAASQKMQAIFANLRCFFTTGELANRVKFP